MTLQGKELYWKRTAIMIAVPLLMFLQGCGGKGITGGTDSTDSVAERADYTADACGWSDSIIGGMTLREKAGQLLMPAIYAVMNEETEKLLKYYVDSLHVGGVLLLKGDVESVKKISDFLYSRGKVRPFIAIDAEWGLGMRLEDAPVFPRNGRIKEEADEDLMFEYGAEVARECRLMGINMVLGPVVDVSGAPGFKGVIGSRSFGSDPLRVARLGVAYARGLESGNVISVAKHFPGHGGTVTDSHKSLPRLMRGKEEMENVDLVPFKDYIASGLSGIMVGHLSVPSLDSIDRPAAFSPVIIDELLRDRLGFNGLVLTDALNMKGSSGGRASEAIIAGADIVTAPLSTADEVENIIKRVESGELSELALRNSCRRILFSKYALENGVVNPKVPVDYSEAARISGRLKRAD